LERKKIYSKLKLEIFLKVKLTLNYQYKTNEKDISITLDNIAMMFAMMISAFDNYYFTGAVRDNKL